MYFIVLYFYFFYFTYFFLVLFYCILLYSLVLSCTLLHSLVFSCSLLFCSVLFCSVLFCSILFYSILFYSILFYVQTRSFIKNHDLPDMQKADAPSERRDSSLTALCGSARLLHPTAVSRVTQLDCHTVCLRHLFCDSIWNPLALPPCPSGCDFHVHGESSTKTRAVRPCFVWFLQRVAAPVCHGERRKLITHGRRDPVISLSRFGLGKRLGGRADGRTGGRTDSRCRDNWATPTRVHCENF